MRRFERFKKFRLTKIFIFVGMLYQSIVSKYASRAHRRIPRSYL
jgi:hypothetical protein